MNKYKIVLNSSANLRELLQEAYKLADEQLIQAQNEMNKLANSTKLQDEIMASKKDYCKAMNDYLSIKDKAISKKLDIAKLLSEIMKHNGNVDKALSDSEKNKSTSFDFSKIREIINNQGEDINKKEIVELKKP